MKVVSVALAHHVAFGGAMCNRLVGELEVDWDRRVVRLQDGRLIPMENVTVLTPTEPLDGAPIYAELAKAAPREAHVCGCGKVYGNPQGLGAHQRFCKGAAT